MFFHAGLDIGNRGGAVVAPEAGRVVAVGQPIKGKASPFGGYGPWVVAIKGDSGFFHWLAHVDKPTVKRNQYVEPGEIVALATGTTWPHVHWEIRQVLVPYKGEKYWPWTVSIDPVRWLNFTELTALDALDRVKTATTEWKKRIPRMQALGRTYPIRLKWGKAIQTSVKHAVQQLEQSEMLEIATGIVSGLAILAVLLHL